MALNVSHYPGLSQRGCSDDIRARHPGVCPVLSVRRRRGVARLLCCVVAFRPCWARHATSAANLAVNVLSHFESYKIAEKMRKDPVLVALAFCRVSKFY